MDKAVALISGIFTDILAPLSAGGIIKGLVVVSRCMGWLSTNQVLTKFYMQLVIVFSTSYSILGVTAARRFHMNQFIGLAMVQP